jgi:hypothetical protein
MESIARAFLKMRSMPSKSRRADHPNPIQPCRSLELADVLRELTGNTLELDVLRVERTGPLGP